MKISQFSVLILIFWQDLLFVVFTGPKNFLQLLTEHKKYEMYKFC
jgi:hypothetical protein